jgi:hypothetical protein
MIQNFLNRNIESKKEQVGIAGFSLFARVREVTNFKSQAPVTYLEDGSPVQDHIINDPITLTIEGVVGDIYIERSPLEKRLNKINALIGKTTQFLPQRTISAIQKTNAAINKFRDRVRKIESAVQAGTSILGFTSPTKPPQEAFLDLMEASFEGKQLVKVEMRYRTYEEMRITDLSLSKLAESDAVSFSLTAVKIRKVQPVYAENSELKKSPSGGVAGQTAGQADKGAQAPKPPQQSLLSRGAGIFQR